MKSMRERLLGHLKRQWITPIDALGLVGCLSLSQRVGEIERGGTPVARRWVHLKSGKRVMSYRIVR